MESKDIDSIILVGLQTEYCIDATCKSAFDFEYKIIILEETNTTFDNQYLSGEKIYEFNNYITILLLLPILNSVTIDLEVFTIIFIVYYRSGWIIKVRRKGSNDTNKTVSIGY